MKPNFVPDVAIGKLPRQDFLLFIGRLTEEKGIEILISLAEKSTYPIKILGDGPLRSLVEKASQRLPHIEYLGFKDKNTITALLQTTKALLFPSLWYEGMPMVILEAFSTGTPLIASNLGGPATMIKNGVHGYLFSPGNVQELSQKIAALTSDPEKYKKMHQACRQEYEEKYSPMANYEQLVSIYQLVIDTKKSNTQL
ncbi:MAG: glycosyltransferase family 4 protein [Microscillaceae bacterium]|nr:glycosyltransferase family 4 protein [Microscillaceae bacterium]